MALVTILPWARFKLGKASQALPRMEGEVGKFIKQECAVPRSMVQRDLGCRVRVEGTWPGGGVGVGAGRRGALQDTVEEGLK